MRLTCNKCKHSWDGDVSVGSAGVMCPECMAFVPLVLATGGAGVAPAGRSVHEEQTIITGGGNIHEMPTVMPAPSPVAAPRSATHVPQQSAPRPAPSGGSPLPPPPPNMPKFATQQGAAGPSGFDNGPDVYRIDAEGQTMPAPPRSGTQVPIATAASEDHTVLTPSQVAAKRPAVDDSSARTPTIRQMDATSGPEDQTMPSRPAPTPGGAATQQGGASKPSAAQAAAVAPGKMDLTGQVIGGYEITKKLGAGGMGAVFMARQISLDRMVAMKVLPSQMAENPDLLMRFTREALSAAQLTHHNIIQVYDVGSVDTLHYITMEFVKGQSLGDIIRKDGKLTFDDAAAYVLQAARGLKYAHERGIIHRDIKPDNLMVNEHGIVKIADMGLAKMTGEVAKAHGKRDLEKEQLLLQEAVGDLTMAEVAMGTPAYMPPEQARDAGSVDHRADQYSLGCTLYYLCAGRAPYSGTTAYELITKHMNEPLTPLETVVKGVPAALSRIIGRMLEKEPEARYPSLAEAIKDLEAYLGVAAEGGEYKPREQHLAILEQNAKAYYSAKSMPLRKFVPLGFFGLMALFAVASIFGGKFVLAGGFIGFAVLTPVANFIIDGILTKSFLFRRVRSVFFGMTLRGWVYTVLIALIGAASLWFLKLLWAWMGFSIAAIGAGAAYHFAVQRRLRQERSAAIQNMQEMLKQLRVRGVPEEGLQDFTGRFAGDNWEEFFEDLFGYDAMIVQRGKWAAQDKIRPRKKFATWRDSIFRFLDDLEQARKVARERAQLKKVEVQRLKSQGIDQAAAEKQADMEATRILAEDLLPKAQKMSEASAGAGTARTLNLRGSFFKPAMIFGLVRFAIGLLIVGAAAHRILGKDSNFPGFVVSLFTTLIYNNSPSGKLPYLGVDSSLLMVVVGAMLLVMAFSKRHVLQTIALLGASMVVATNLILPLLPVPGLNNTLLYFAGAGIEVAVFAYCLYSKMGGGKF